ncbi:MAG: hemerythrin domain-containing protein [Pseudolabrys sp.]
MTVDRAHSNEIEVLALARRTGWPEDLRVLLERYPRERWDAHANLGEMARFWLSRHAMFRELSETIEQVTQRFRAGKLPPAEFARQFAPRLQFILDQLNVHHQIEDFHYFPIFRAADARLAIGFDVLEGDHHHIHGDMARTAETANALLQALRSDTDTLRRCSDGYVDASATLLKGLIRHLDDEEDLIVPLILDRGEEKLGVAHHG